MASGGAGSRCLSRAASICTQLDPWSLVRTGKVNILKAELSPGAQTAGPTETLTGCVSEGSDWLALGHGPAPAVRRGHGLLPFNPVERGTRKEGSVPRKREWCSAPKSAWSPVYSGGVVRPQGGEAPRCRPVRESHSCAWGPGAGCHHPVSRSMGQSGSLATAEWIRKLSDLRRAPAAGLWEGSRVW